jgi:hypothetical protein
MDNIVLQFPLKPLSINKKSTISNRGRFMIKTMEARRFEDAINKHLDKHAQELKFFRNNIRDHEALSLSITIYVPKSEYFTKKGTINLKCLDTSNSIKILEDIIYSRMDVNDGLNCKINAEKRPWSGDGYITLVVIEKMTQPKACYLDELPNLIRERMMPI